MSEIVPCAGCGRDVRTSSPERDDQRCPDCAGDSRRSGADPEREQADLDAMHHRQRVIDGRAAR